MDEILKQLGGNKFLSMTGAKNLIGDNKELSMKLEKNNSKANMLIIKLKPDDTYTMKFSKFTPGKLNMKTFEFEEAKEKVIEVIEDIYCDQLQVVFTEVTGMDTKL